MNKQTKEQKSINLAKKVPEQTVVQKVVNQRYTNGKRQFKVIWLGRPFEQATWVEEQKLNCPEKIAEFLKRYQQVMKKKNLQSKIQADASNPISPMKLESALKPQLKKLSLEKPDNVTQRKLIISPSANLNKQKLQASLQKNNLIPSKNNSENQPPTPTLNLIKTYNSYHKAQNEHQIENNSNLASKNSIEIVSKSQKISENDQKGINGVGKPKNKSTNSSRRQELNDEFEEDTAQTNDQFSLWAHHQIFIDATERLQIEKISGMVIEFEGGDFQKSVDSFLNQKNRKDQIPAFFLVKNKFSDEQKLISRQRMIHEQPLKLIEYYEALLQVSQQLKA